MLFSNCYRINISLNLKDIMVDKKIKDVKELSSCTGIGKSVLYGYLNNQFLPSLKNAYNLCYTLNVSFDYLFGFSNINKKVKNNNTFFYNYCNLLKQYNTTNNSVCKELGICGSSYSAWKRGKFPTIKSLILIAKHFNVGLDYLIGNINYN